MQTVDSTNTVGYYPSLKYDAADNPVIAYYYKTGGDLRFASNDGTGWDIAAIDTVDDVGRYPSLALNPASGRWAVAYETTGGRGFKFAQKTKTAWSTTLVDDNGGAAGSCRWRSTTTTSRRSATTTRRTRTCGWPGSTASTWGTQTIAAKNSQGLYSNLFFDAGQAGGLLLQQDEQDAERGAGERERVGVRPPGEQRRAGEPRGGDGGRDGDVLVLRRGYAELVVRGGLSGST